MKRFFAGRMNRTTYLLVILTLGLAAVVLRRPDVSHYLDTNSGAAGLAAAGGIVLIVWQIAASARRLHDVNVTGWYAVLVALPGVQLLLLIWPGTKGDNRYGTEPTELFDLTNIITNESPAEKP